MAKVDHSTSYYQKMAELQEKLKRSEEERMKLEEKFALMMKSCREEEEKRIRALRERYEKFLEDDKRRRDRNERILQTLEKIESRSASLSAKSERLKLLRKHYEAYLLRMYPLWKKHSSPVIQQSVPTQYPLSLPMDTEKHLPWFGSSSGLYMNNMPLPSTRSSMSPGSDQLWVPPVSSRNIPMYDNAKPLVAHKTVERKDSEVEACSPAAEGALDNYLHRAAELLRVPVEELEGHSEKRDEEKSVHTEQDTSRDLLNVSLSDDSILVEKKAEKTARNVVENTKGTNERMTDEEKRIPEVDYLAGGDNLLSEAQTAKMSAEFPPQNVPYQPVIKKDNENKMIDKNSSDPNQRRPEISDLEKNIQENGLNKLSDQELLANRTPQLSQLQKTQEERLVIADQNNFQVSDENSENIPIYPNVQIGNDAQVPFVNTIQEYSTNDVTACDPSYQNVQQPVSEIQREMSDIDQESPKNVEQLNYALEQEAANERQEYVENIRQNEDDIVEQHANVSHQEYTENPEHTAQYIVADQEKQTTELIGETYQENPYEGGAEAAQYIGSEQNYGPQETPVEQYEQDQYGDNVSQQYEQYPDNTQQYEQYPDNTQQYEQYPDNTQQYEQEQYVDNGGQPYEQQYPQQYGDEQYIENTPQFEQPQQIDNSGEHFGDQYGDHNDQYEGQDTDPNQDQNKDDEINNQYSTEDVHQSLIHTQNINQGDPTITEGQSQQGSGRTQPLLNISSEGGAETIQNVGAEQLIASDQTLQEGNVQLLEGEQEIRNTQGDEVLENQEKPTGDITQTVEKEGVLEDNVARQEELAQQQHVEGNVTGQESATLLNPDVPSAVEDDSEESSAGFWNPPHHSTIPSVDELTPKAVVVEDTSESSVDSKMDPPTGKPPAANTVQQFRSLLGVPADPAGDSALSDQDDVEDQLAALVEDPIASAPVAVESKHDLKTKETKKTEKNQSVKTGKTTAAEPVKSKSAKNSKSTKSSEGSKPSTRTGLKKPPSLIKVLESDSESLNLNTGAASNVDSDEFDFSTE